MAETTKMQRDELPETTCTSTSTTAEARSGFSPGPMVHGCTPSGFPFCDDEKLARSVLLERFPYRVYYYVDADDLFVIALLHGRRRPGLYRGR